MINLLPPEEKKKLLSERKKKIVIIFWILILFFIFCLILILFSVKICLQIETKSERALLAVANEGFNQPEIQNLRERIESANSNLRKLDSFYKKKIYFSDILENVSKIFPQQIFLTNFSIISSVEKEKESLMKVSFSGFSPTREILFNFRKELENNSYFQEVYFPPSDWVKSNDIDFFTTFKINNI